MSCTGVSSIYPNVIQRNYKTVFKYSAADAKNPIEVMDRSFNYCRSKQTKLSVIRSQDGEVKYSFDMQFTGGNGLNYLPSDKNNYIAYLTNTAVETFPVPGSLFDGAAGHGSVTWPPAPLNQYTVSTSTGDGGGREYLIRFWSYRTTPPSIQLIGGAALAANDEITLIVNIPYYQNL